MTEKKNSRKGINTRAHLALSEQFYVWRMCEYFAKKIHHEWENKNWHLQGFGNTLLECRVLGKYDPFLKMLKEDMMSCLIEHNYRSTPPSETTLENLLGEVSQRPHFFQKQMREILAIYVGYENWDDFRRKESLPYLPPSTQPNFVLLETPILPTLPVVLENGLIVIRENESEQAEIVAALYFHFFGQENIEEVPFQEVKIPKKLPLWFILFFGLGVALATLFFNKERMYQFYKEWTKPQFTQAELDKVIFEVDSVYGEANAPKTLQVRYDVSPLKGDSVEIKFNSWFDWRYLPQVKTIQKKGKATHLYYNPLADSAFLYVDKKLVKKIKYRISFVNWVASVFRNRQNGIVHTWLGLDSSKVKYEGRLHVPPQIIDRTDFPEYNTSFEYVPYKKLSFEIDHCEISFRVRNSLKDGGLKGREIRFVIHSKDKGFLLISTRDNYWNRIECGESTFGANSYPNSTLEKLAWDFEEWKTVKVEINQPKLKIWFEDKLVWNTQYEGTIGSFSGIRFGFLGSGTVDFVKVWNEKRELVYEENFD